MKTSGLKLGIVAIGTILAMYSRRLVIALVLSLTVFLYFGPALLAQEGIPHGQPGGDPNAIAVKTPPLTPGAIAPAAPLELQKPRPESLSPDDIEAKEEAERGNAKPTTKPGVKPPLSGEIGNGLQLPGLLPNIPVLGGSFLGDSGFAPPPDLTVAAGHNHVITATNGTVNIFTNQGVLVAGGAFGTCAFFNQGPTTLCLATDAHPISDPKVVYDEYLDRFWVVAIALDEPSTRSVILIALSNSGDPTAGWSLFSLNAVDGDVISTNWCDFPQVGIDAQALYVSCNMFSFPGIVPSFFRYSKLRVMTKPQFISGGPIFWWDFKDGDLCEGGLCLGRSFAIQPAHMRGARVVDGEFLANYHHDPFSSVVVIRRVTHAETCCVPGSQSAPILERVDQGVGSADPPPSARQPGTATGIDTGDTRLLYAVWQAGLLSMGQNLACHSPADACVAFTEFDVSGFPTTITTRNDWFLDAPAGSDHYYPAVDVNRSGKKTMVFSRSAASEFASAVFLGITASGALDGPETTLNAGSGTYINTGCPPSGSNRWGDYSGATADPDGVGVWVFGESSNGTSATCPDGVTVVNGWAAQVGITYDATFPRPKPQISDIFPSTAFVGDAGLQLTVDGSNFVPDSVVRWQGQDRATIFVSDTELTASISSSDLTSPGVFTITVFTPTPGGGTSNVFTFGVATRTNCTKTFSPPGADRRWETDVNWNPSGVPGASDHACIFGNFAVTLSGGSQSVASLEVGSSSPLAISGGSLTTTSDSFIGVGGLVLNAGTLTTANLTLQGSFALSGGTLTGSGTVTLNNSLTWTNGTIAGGGTINANGGINFGDGYRTLDTRTLNNSGSAVWNSGSGYSFSFSNGAVLNNLAGGVLDFQTDGSQIVGTGTLANAGTLKKSGGTGTMTLGVGFNNTGTVMAQSGALGLDGGGASSGAFSVASGATLRFTGNFGSSHSLGGSLSGNGTVAFLGTTNFVAGADLTSFSGLLDLSSGTADFSSGGALTSQATLKINGGTLKGSDALTVNALNWGNGTMSGSGSTTVIGNVVFADGYKTLDTRTLNNSGSAVWNSGSGYSFSFSNGAVLNNLAGGVLDFQTDGSQIVGTGTLVNAGTLKKSGGAGTMTLGVGFNNTGTVMAQSGTLQFQNGYVQTAGSTVLSGGSLSTLTTPLNLQGGSLSGFGSIAGSVLNGLQTSLGVTPSDPAILSITGSYTQSSAGALNMKIGGLTAGSQFDQVAVGGAATLDGTLNVSLINGFTPAAGNSFTVMTFSSDSGTFATANLPPLPGGLNWSVQYGPSSVTLSVQ